MIEDLRTHGVLRARVRAALARLWRFRLLVPLSPLGALVLATAFGLHSCLATTEVDFVLHAASLSAVGLVAFSVLIVIATALVLRLRLPRRPSKSPAPVAVAADAATFDATADLELESGVVSATGLLLPRLRGWPLVQVRLVWVEPGSVEVQLEPAGGRSVQEVVLPRRRGRHSALRRCLVVSDIFGLARFGLWWRTARRVRIRPARARLSGHAISHVVGGDALSHPDGPPVGDPLDMRRYVHGDPLRRVLWKAYARTRQLLVRMPEQAIMPSPSGVGYLVAGPGDEPTASAARFFVEAGLLGDDFLFGADGCAEPTSDATEAVEQIVTSADFAHRGAEGLARFLDRLEQRRRRSCVLFLPPVSGRWLDRVERAAVRVPGALAVVAVDHDLAPVGRRRISRLLFTPDGPSSDKRQRRAARALPELVARLRRAGLELRVVHRPSGQMIPVAQLEALATRAVQ